MQAVKLKLKLVENEKVYRDRFFDFLEILKIAADKSEFFKQTKTKTILKISEEVLKCSEDLLLVMDNRKRILQQSEAIYKDIDAHHGQAVGILSSYCTNLLDVRDLLLSSMSPDCREFKVSCLMKEALQPVRHVEDILGLLHQINEELVANHRPVEIFSCNSLIDQLTKGLERVHKTIAGLHAEELLLASEDMSTEASTVSSVLASASLTEAVVASKADNVSASFSSYAELRSPTRSEEHRKELARQNDSAASDCEVLFKKDEEIQNQHQVFTDETLRRSVKFQSTETQLQRPIDTPADVLDSAPLAEHAGASHKENHSETFTSFAELRSNAERKDRNRELEVHNDNATRDCDTQSLKKMEAETTSAEWSSRCSVLPQSPGSQLTELRVCDIPDQETQLKKKPPMPSPRTRRPLVSFKSDSTSFESDYEKCSRTDSVLLRRESKKLIRNEVQSIAMKISELKSDISSLEMKIVGMESSGSSESDDENIDAANGDYPEVFEDSETVGTCAPDGANCSGVMLRSESIYYDAGMRDRRTKHLLHSTIWQVPLYQEYHVDVTDETEASASAREAPQENPTDAGAANSTGDLDRNSRPESGIEVEGEVEGEEEGEESLGCFYTPMWNNGFGLVECADNSADYVPMIRTQNTDKFCNVASNGNPKTYAWTWDETKCSGSARDSTGCTYMAMNRVYANMHLGNSCKLQDDSIYNSVHDIFGAVQVEKESAAQEEYYREEIANFVPTPRAKQMPGWCNIPAVRESGLLENMTKKQRHLQEAKYELISSKVSYLKSLSVLQAIFIENADLKRLMSSTDWSNLFQYIGPIKQCSEHFLADLLSGWPQDIFMSNQLLVVRQYALTGLQTYVNYCSNKMTMDKTLANIRANNPRVNNALKKLESDEICDNNTLESFLVLPIQRITRFPLLVEGIISRMDSNTDKDFVAWAKTYQELVEMAKRCNDAVRESDESLTSEMTPREVCSKTMPARNRMSSAFRKSTKSTTLPKRHGSTIWHDNGQ